jgi:iron complex outermembrane recepter protein
MGFDLDRSAALWQNAALLPSTMKTNPILFIAAFPLVAFAQIPALEPLEVQGKRFGEIYDSPDGSATIVNREQMANSRESSFTFQDLFQTIPGGYSGNPTSGNFSLRGVSQESFFPVLGNSSSPMIQVLEDGAPLSTTTLRYLPPVLWDRESATVLRGPQSALPGPNSLAGELQIQSTPANGDWSGRALLEAAESDTLRIGAAQNFALIPDQLSARFSYFHQESAGDATNVTLDNDRFAETSRDRYQLQLAWKPTATRPDQVSLSIIQESSRGNPNALTQASSSFGFFDRKTALNTPSSYPADRWAATLNTRFELPNDWELGTTTSFQRLDLGSQLDFDSTPLLQWFIHGVTDEERFTQDAHLSEKQGDFQWQTGAYYEHSEYSVDLSGEGVIPAPPYTLPFSPYSVFGTPFTSILSETVEVFALYGRADYEFTRSWHIKGGLRLNHEERSADTFVRISTSPTSTNHENLSSDELLPEIALAWQPDEKNETGLRLARGMRSGGTAHAASLGITRTYDPEYNLELELYSRNRITNQVEISGGIFHSWMTDQQVAYDVPTGFPGIDRLMTNAGSSRRYGAELQTQWSPLEGLAIHGTAAWVHSEFRSLEIDGIDRSGQAFPNAPEWMASIGADYLHSSGIFGSLLYSWADSTYIDPANPVTTHLESRSLLSARLGYQWEKASIYLFGTNLLNDEYAVSRVDNSGLGLPVGGKVAPPRILGIGCEARW